MRRRAAKVDPKAPLDAARSFCLQYRVGNVNGLRCWNGDHYLWMGTHWRHLPEPELRALLYQWLQGCTDYQGQEIKPTRRLVNDVLDALASDVYLALASEPNWLPGHAGEGAPGNLLVCRNGLLDMPSRKLQQSDVRLFATTVLPVDFNPRAGQPVAWLRFLAMLWPDDPEAIALLQEWIALCALTDDTSHQKALLIVGPRRSGKGTILRILRELAGPANVCSPTFASLGMPFGLQSLIGKRVALLSDARLSGRADVAVIAENLLRITGEDAVSVPRKHQIDWNGTLPSRFTVATNELPAMADASAALSSRFLILRLTRTFYGAEDHQLTAKLLQELPAILLWALDGLDRLRRRGRLVQPASSQELVDELEALASPITMFVRDCCVLAPTAEGSISSLYDRWLDWCRDAGRDHPGTAADFGKKLRAAFPQIRTTQPRRQGRQVRCYAGLRVRHVGDPDTR
ncbi:DNA primase family protein [Pseudoxanthomonas wuyuanensis]|nr:phage/plasmid primase, P4 family [Pseudoxanthomonas wuyuanensis]